MLKNLRRAIPAAFRRPPKRNKAPCGRVGAGPVRLVDIPEVMTPNPYVLERLREVDPAVDLFYIGLGVWAFGSVQPNQKAFRIGNRQIALERERPVERQTMGRFRMARLVRAGFRIIDLVDFSEIESMKVVRDFRFADWRYRHMADQAFEENLDGSDEKQEFQQRLSTVLDLHRGEGLDIFRQAMRGRTGLLQTGVSWGRN